MTITYFLGVFNDNFYKQAALLLAVTAGLSGLQGRATEVFSLPFILFSAWGGWLADRFSKKHVVIGVKGLELVAMLIGAYGLITLNWTWVLAMLFLMGLQSTLFGPALNGSIPELFPPNLVTRANSTLKLASTLAILIGMVTAGFVLDCNFLPTAIPPGRFLAAASVVLVAVVGIIASFGVHYRPRSGNPQPFPWTGPLSSIRDILNLKQDPLLLLAVCGDAFFYCISLLAILIINTLGVKELGLSASITSLLAVSLMLGVCMGAFAAAKLTSHRKWTHILVPSAVGMGITLTVAGGLVALCNKPSFVLLMLPLTGAGFFGGLFLIPITSFIQVRPASDVKGRIIAAAGFLSFVAMWFSGRIFTSLDSMLQPSSSMMLVGGAAVCGGLVLLYCRQVMGICEELSLAAGRISAD